MQDKFINDNLVEMCEEMVEYRDTGVLRQGLVRELAKKLYEDSVVALDAQRLAEFMVKDAAVAFVAAPLTLSAAYAGIVTDKEREEFMTNGKYPEVVTKGCLQEVMASLIKQANDDGDLTGYDVIKAIQELFE